MEMGGIKLNSIECRDCIRGLADLGNNKVNLVITSPPGYNPEYKSYEDYLGFLRATIYLTHQVLVSNGVLAINIPKHYISNGVKYPIQLDLSNILIDIGFGYQDTIIWDNSNGVEYILIFNKGSNSLPTDKSVWKINSVGVKSGVVPFPVGVTDKLVEMYSKPKGVVLDPFIGTGTTAISCIKLGRNYIGYDNNQELVKLSNMLVNKFQNDIKVMNTED